MAPALAIPRHFAVARLDHSLCTELPLSWLFHKQDWVEGIFLLAAALPRQEAIIRIAGLALAYKEACWLHFIQDQRLGQTGRPSISEGQCFVGNIDPPLLPRRLLSMRVLHCRQVEPHPLCLPCLELQILGNTQSMTQRTCPGDCAKEVSTLMSVTLPSCAI